MASVLDLVKHYQHAIEKYPDDEQKILKCIDKLFHLDVTVQHLQETGVGRTVNALRKESGEVGQAARSLVYKWKLMVAAEESDQEGDHNDSSNYNGNGQEKDSDDNTGGSRTKEKSIGSCKTKDMNYKQMNGDHSGTKRKYNSSEEEEQDRKRSKHSSSRDRNGYEQKPVIKQEPESQSDSYSDSTDSDSESSEEETKPIVKVKTEPPEQKPRYSQSSYSDSKSESSKRSHDSPKHVKQESKHSSEKSSSREKSSSKHKSSSEKENSDRKSEHRSSDKDRKHKEEIKSSKHSAEKHKPSSEKSKSTSEKNKSSEKSSSKSNKTDSKLHKSDKHKHKSSSEKESSSDKHKSSSSSSKDKYSSSNKELSKEKSKEKSSSSKDNHSISSHSKSERHSNDNKSRDSRGEHKSGDKTKHKSSSSSSRSSKHKEDIPKKKSKSDSNEDSEDGIGCESGASFAEALGMISPAKPKKKPTGPEKSKDTSPTDPWNDDLSPANLLAPTARLAPLPKIEISSLPEISTNYKPRPPPKFLPHFTDEEALNVSMSSKNQRTKVYSGNKIMGKVPSLYELCVNVLQEHIDALEYTGGVPYEILKPVVDKATPQQLFVLEHYNPYLMDDTDHLWQAICEKQHRNKKRQEMETWREMYMRCQEEQESKLKSLTENIKIAQEAKKAPIKQTKMAYVDSVVKPPRNIARKQALHGTAHLASASPASRVASLSSAHNILRSGVRAPPAPPVSSTSFHKQKKAPLMQKALQFMRGRKR